MFKKVVVILLIMILMVPVSTAFCEESPEIVIDTVEATTCDHIAGDWEIEAATCITEGTKVQKCTVCNEVLVSETIPFAMHTYGEWIETIAATTTEDGEESQTCTNCGFVSTRAIAATGGTKKESTPNTELLGAALIPCTEHTFTPWIPVLLPTCSEFGAEARQCIVCGLQEPRILNKIDHTEGDWETFKEATTITDGAKVKKCKVCNEVVQTEMIPLIPNNEVHGVVLTNGSNLNLREKPSTSSKIIGKLNIGNEIQVLEENGKWLKVKSGDKTGYVYAKYLRVKVKPSDSEEPVKIVGYGVVKIKLNSKLNLRAGASFSSKILLQLRSGDQVKVLAKEGDWFKVKIGDVIGYVNSKYLSYEEKGMVYTALGDSIAYGTGGTGDIGYVDLLKDYLAETNTLTLDNAYDLSKNYGMSSSDLLDELDSDFSKIVNADVITISIGGNDILDAVRDIDPVVFMAMSPEQQNALLYERTNLLTTNATLFTTNWAEAITKIKVMNPNATIYVNTLYNPFKSTDLLYPIADPLISGMNEFIKQFNYDNKYDVVDVYSKFKEPSSEKLVHDDFTDRNNYLHPTNSGYNVIHNLHMERMSV